jgi:hypothetical protein
MLPNDIEAYVNRLNYPKGGVAPLRHELATYEYLERQRQYDEQAEPFDVMAFANAALKGTLGLVTHLFARLAPPFESEG